MLYFHGGGFALGDLDGEDRTCRSLCVGRKNVVVGVDYRLAPENPYPAALDDSWDSLDWVDPLRYHSSLDSRLTVTVTTEFRRPQYRQNQDSRRRHLCRRQPRRRTGSTGSVSGHLHPWPITQDPRRLPKQNRAACPWPVQHGRDARLAHLESWCHGTVFGLVQTARHRRPDSVASFGVLFHGCSSCLLSALRTGSAAGRGTGVCGCIGSCRCSSTGECVQRCPACVLDFPRGFQDTGGRERIAGRCAVAAGVML